MAKTTNTHAATPESVTPDVATPDVPAPDVPGAAQTSPTSDSHPQPPASPVGEPVAEPATALLPLHDLAHRHRVPTWQQAALGQLMGWAEGKQLTDADYRAGLERLSGRRMGGL